MIIRHDHPFAPDPVGTQCTVYGCWGLVDDPRHLAHTREPKPVPNLLGPARARAPRGRRGRMPYVRGRS